MTKTEFLAGLENALAQLPREERQSNVDFYAELFDDMIEEGMTGEEAAARLGDPSEIARGILEEMPINKLVRDRIRPQGGWTPMAVVLAILGSPLWIALFAALFAVVLAVVAVMWVIVLALFAGMAALIVGGLAVFVGLLLGAVHGAGSVLLFLGAGFIVLAVGILVGVGSVYAAKLAVKVCAALWRGIKSLFIKKER